MTLLLLLFYGAVLSILHAYLLFPLIVLLRGALWPRPWQPAPIEPEISLIVACHNEAAAIGDRIQNLRDCDYPPDKLQLIVVSDGSDDGTERIAEATGVTCLALPRVGKAGALNAGVAAATGEILVFSDANSIFEPDALRKLVRHFADPSIGGVAGDLRYAEGPASGERSYWSLDRLLKSAESRAGNVISATGSIYAIRRSTFVDVPGGVTDDFVTSTRVIAQGLRLVFDPEAIALEPPASTAPAEFRRKYRVITRGLYGVWVMRELLNPLRHGFYAFALFSHKLLRRVVALPLLLLLPVSFALWNAGPVYQLTALAQTALYGAALIGLLLGRSRLARLPLFSFPLFFCMVNTAALVAIYNLLRGHRISRWAPERG